MMTPMATLNDLDDLDLATVELDDGTPLLAAWRAAPGGGGTWVAQRALPASAVQVEVEPGANRLTRDGLYPSTTTVQDLVRSWLRDGFNTMRVVTDDDPDDPTQARSFLLTDYRRRLAPTELGSNGSLFGLSYGRPGEPAGGFANVTSLVAEVRASEDPVNEIGGCIAALQLGRGGDPPPTASLWGSSYTLRGSVGRQPGGLMAYTAVVQNYFDGSGSRSANYGFAALTRPGIGDGADFHIHDTIRDSTTYPVDYGFVVCGDSGPHPDGGEIGYRVAFQAGGAASPWATRDEWRSRIGTGVLVRDWLEAGIHVHPPHRDAGVVSQLRLDRRDNQEGNLLECRSEDGLGLLAAIRPDGRIATRDAIDPVDAVTRAQLDAAVGDLARDLRAATERLAALERERDLRGVPARALGREMARRVAPAAGRRWRRARDRVRGWRAGRVDALEAGSRPTAT
jgi:hypothetical protein